jgi:two-component sensor histidine kinase
MQIYYPFTEKKRARVVFADEQNQRLWLGYSNGLFMWENGLIQEVKWQDSISIFAKSITKDTQSNIWVGTLTQGLFLIENKKIGKKIGIEQGLPSNLCLDLFAEKDVLWIGTDKGLVKLSLPSYGIEIYNRQDGLPSEQINGLIALGENVWLATPKGLVKMPKSVPSKNLVPPMIYLEQVSVWEKPLPFNSTYQLNADENNLLINFLGVTYRSRGFFKYKYRMVGLDNSWIYTNSNNSFARYPSLPAGKYEFQVKAVNEDGIESEGTAVVQIEIKRPISQKWWFLLIVAILFALLIFLVVRWRFQLLQKRNEVEKNLRESQLAALKVQMNPHFIFNALNSIQEFILLNEKKLANQYLGKFADLMRMTLDMSNEERISLQEEIKMLDLYLQLEALRFENLAYQLDIDESLKTADVVLPSMLVQPYIENALKHGLLHKQGLRKLNISFQQKYKYLECIVEDNGIGRVKSAEMNRKKHKSFAISATQKRLDLLNYGNKNSIQSEIIDLYDENRRPKGTKVILRIPMV